MKPGSTQPDRKHTAHHPPLENHNTPILICLTVCTHKRRMVLASERIHSILTEIWSSSSQ
jgi:hypothetical protein